MNVIRVWGNMTRMVEYFVSTNSSLMAMCKLIVTWYHGKKLQQLIVSIMTDWMTATNWERNIMLKSARRSRNISFRCCATVTGLIIMSFCLYTIRFIKIVHLPYRTLIYRMDNIQKSPTYEITYCIQFLGGMYSLLAIYTIDSFVSILVLHTCSQLTNLRMTLNNLVNEITNDSISSSRKESFRTGLAAIVIRHEHLIRNAKTIDSCYSSLLFMNILLVILQICFIAFQIFTSTNMAYGIYECKWYNLPSKDAKDLMFIVYRSKIPLKLTAGKFGIFSIEMFGSTIKTAMGYLSALLTIRG
ncbi:PREDICTED: uncharacterized protein LOC105622729 [Atta cephalotes]|uniref:Odorant receptor n=1 Tax=Atta cephalotes TaxID=12957 RepID=A0A158NPS7_ATTCE|nr:PREDICTED: uncharacterized protein LOC105622729 [Atta cephalotes]